MSEWMHWLMALNAMTAVLARQAAVETLSVGIRVQDVGTWLAELCPCEDGHPEVAVHPR